MTTFDKRALALAMQYPGQVLTKADVIKSLKELHIPKEDWYKED